MKRIFVFFAVLSFLFVGCAKTNAVVKEETAEPFQLSCEDMWKGMQAHYSQIDLNQVAFESFGCEVCGGELLDDHKCTGPNQITLYFYFVDFKPSKDECREMIVSISFTITEVGIDFKVENKQEMEMPCPQKDSESIQG